MIAGSFGEMGLVIGLARALLKQANGQTKALLRIPSARQTPTGQQARRASCSVSQSCGSVDLELRVPRITNPVSCVGLNSLEALETPHRSYYTVACRQIHFSCRRL